MTSTENPANLIAGSVSNEKNRQPDGIKKIFTLPKKQKSTKLSISSKPQKTSSGISTSLVCTECGFQFKRRDHLKDHIRAKHTSDKIEFDCSVCDSKFGYQQNLWIHMKRTHNWTKEQISQAKNERQKNATVHTRKRNIIQDLSDEIPTMKLSRIDSE